jgi:hypothetical protein
LDGVVAGWNRGKVASKEGVGEIEEAVKTDHGEKVKKEPKASKL